MGKIVKADGSIVFTNLTGRAAKPSTTAQPRSTTTSIPERWKKASERAQAAKAKRDSQPTTADPSNKAGDGSGVAQFQNAEVKEKVTPPTQHRVEAEESPPKSKPNTGAENVEAGVEKGAKIINELDQIMGDIDKQK